MTESQLCEEGKHPATVVTWSSGDFLQARTTEAKFGYTHTEAGKGQPGKSSVTLLAFSTRASTDFTVSPVWRVVRSIEAKQVFSVSSDALSGSAEEMAANEEATFPAVQLKPYFTR